MQYIEAGKFLKKKRKGSGYKTQKSFIDALMKIDPDINCSESYISLIESGVKSPGLHLLDAMAEVLTLTKQEKGELLLIYKRVPNDFELTVKSNLKENLKVNTIDSLRKRYEKHNNIKNLNNYIRALILEGKSDEAINLLKNSTKDNELNFVELQERTARIAAISGNYDFAIQAFQLALQGCNNDNFLYTKNQILINIGVCYFNKALLIKDKKYTEGLDLMLTAKNYFDKGLEVDSHNIFCLDENARCCYNIAYHLDYFKRNNIKLTDLDKTENLKTLINKKNYDSVMIDFYEKSIIFYEKVITNSEKGELLDRALKEAVYFHAYAHCKAKKFDKALFLINSINILEQNWVTFFLKTGYFLLKYEEEKNEEFLSLALKELSIAYQYESEEVISFIKAEKDKELKILWELKKEELENILKGNLSE
ncbi:MAG: helix-turn-helix transcriptional regulator [Candidatus Sericytochromatia bacterium]